MNDNYHDQQDLPPNQKGTNFNRDEMIYKLIQSIYYYFSI